MEISAKTNGDSVKTEDLYALSNSFREKMRSFRTPDLNSQSRYLTGFCCLVRVFAAVQRDLRDFADGSIGAARLACVFAVTVKTCDLPAAKTGWAGMESVGIAVAE